MRITRIAFGRSEEATHPDALRAAFAEFVSTLLFVFAAQGSAIALGKVNDGIATAAGLLAAALSHAFAMVVAVSVSSDLSGGHVNPAISLGVFLSGGITLVRLLLYCLAQLLGSTFACLLLRLCTDLGVRSYAVVGISSRTALVLEMVMTFGLVYTVYATAIDPKKGKMGPMSPLAIGLMVGANTMVGGPFTGAAMNPALVFGSALTGWRWADHWVYWLGPLIGSTVASLVYELVLISPPDHQLLTSA